MFLDDPGHVYPAYIVSFFHNDRQTSGTNYWPLISGVTMSRMRFHDIMLLRYNVELPRQAEGESERGKEKEERERETTTMMTLALESWRSRDQNHQDGKALPS